MKVSALMFTAALAASGPAMAKQPALLKHTQSGKAEATIPGVTVDEFRNEVVLICTKNGMDVQPDQYSVVCSKIKEGGKGFAAQVLLGNRMSGKPYDKIRFTFAQAGKDVFVTAESYLEMTMGFGEIKRIPYTNNAERNDIQQGLDAAAENARRRMGADLGSENPASVAPDTPVPVEPPASSGMKWKPRGY